MVKQLDVRRKQDQGNISATFGNIGKVEMCQHFKTWIFKNENRIFQIAVDVLVDLFTVFLLLLRCNSHNIEFTIQHIVQSLFLLAKVVQLSHQEPILEHFHYPRKTPHPYLTPVPSSLTKFGKPITPLLSLQICLFYILCVKWQHIVRGLWCLACASTPKVHPSCSIIGHCVSILHIIFHTFSS